MSDAYGPESAFTYRNNRERAMKHALQLVSIYPTNIQDIRSFLTDIASAMHISDIDWNGMLEVIQRRLEGVSRLWFNNHKKDLTSLAVFTSRFQQQFGRSASELIGHLTRMTMRDNEDIRAFSDRFLSCMHECDLTDDDPMVLESFLKGIGHHSTFVRLQRPRTVTQAIEIAREVQDAIHITGGHFPFQPVRFENTGRNNSRSHGGDDITQARTGYSSGNNFRGEQFHDQKPPYQYQGQQRPSGRWQPQENSTLQVPPPAAQQHQPYQGRPQGVQQQQNNRGDIRHPWANRNEGTQGQQQNQGRQPSSTLPPSQNTIDALTRQMEDLRIKIHQAQQASGNNGQTSNTRAHMMQQVPTEDFPRVYANEPSAQRPRNIGQLPTFADEPMAETIARPRRAPAVGPRRADDTGVAAAPTSSTDMTRKMMESKKYLMSFKDLVIHGNAQVHQTLANEFNRFVSMSQQQQLSGSAVNVVGSSQSASTPAHHRRVHFSPVPTQLSTPSDTTVRAHSNSEQREEKPGMIEIDILVNKHVVKAYVDSGAEHSVINRPIATTCGLMSSLDQSSSVLCQGVSGPPVRSDGTVKALIELGRAATYLPLVVMNTPDAAFHLLLGVDWCDAFQLEINFASSQLVLNLGGCEQLKIPFQRSNRRKQQFHFTQVSEITAEQDELHESTATETDPYAKFRLPDGSLNEVTFAADMDESCHSDNTDDYDIMFSIDDIAPPTPLANEDLSLETLDKWWSELPWTEVPEIKASSTLCQSDCLLPTTPRATHPVSFFSDSPEQLKNVDQVSCASSSELRIPHRLCYGGITPDPPLTVPISSLLSEIHFMPDQEFMMFYCYQRPAIWLGDTTVPWDRWFGIRNAQVKILQDNITDEVWTRSGIYPPEVTIAEDEEALLDREVQEYFTFMENNSLSLPTSPGCIAYARIQADVSMGDLSNLVVSDSASDSDPEDTDSDDDSIPDLLTDSDSDSDDDSDDPDFSGSDSDSSNGGNGGDRSNDDDFYDNFAYEPEDDDAINYDIPASSFHTASDHIKHSCPAVQIHPTDPSKYLIYVPGYPEPFVAGKEFPTDPNLQNTFILDLFDYRDAFCVEISDLRVPCNILTAHLDTGDHPPIYTPNFRRPPIQEEAFAQLTRILVQNGIVEPSVSPWSSPGMAVPKKIDEDADPATLTIEQQWRHVVDYRNINAISQSDRYPMPVIQDCLERAACGTIYSRLDLKLSFNQILLDDETKPKTSFSTIDGLWQYRRLPMGLKSSPAIFVRAVAIALAPVINKSVVNYFDDLLIVSKDIITHLKDIKEVLDLLVKANLRAAPSKCFWFTDTVKFTGHILEKGIIRMDSSKVRAIVNYPAPYDVRSLQSFLGLAGYYQRHIPRYSHTAFALRILLRKKSIWKWTEVEESAFQALKTALSSEPILKAPDWDTPFLLQTDYSATALAAILSQRDDDDTEHIVACASRACTTAESKLSATEGELSALVYGITHFHRYLFGRRFKVETDHAALAHLHKFKDNYSKLARYAILLQGYDFEVVYKRGTLNGNADALSRITPLHDDIAEVTLTDNFIDFAAPRITSSIQGGEDGDDESTSQHVVSTNVVSIFMNLNLGESSSKRQRSTALFESTAPGMIHPPERLPSGIPAISGGGPSHLIIPRTSDSGSSEFITCGSSSESDSDTSEDPVEEDRGPTIVASAGPSTVVESTLKQPTRIKGPRVEIWNCVEALSLIRGTSISYSYCHGNSETKRAKKLANSYTYENGKIMFKGREVPPPDQRESIMTQAHQNLGHRGARSIVDALIPRYIWMGMKDMSELIVDSCKQCQNRQLKPIVDPVMRSLPLPDFLGRGVLDLFGPYPISRYGNVMVASYIDYHSKWVIARAMPNKEPISVRKFLRDNVIFGIGPPIEIMCDNGGEFYAEVASECEKYGIKMVRGAAYHPQTQGAIERTNRTLQEGLRSCMTGEKPDLWEDYLPECVAGMNFSKQRTIGFSPYQITFGIPPRLPIGLKDNNEDQLQELTETNDETKEIVQGLVDRTRTLNETHTRLVTNVEKNQERQRKEYAERRRTSTGLPAIGTLIWIRENRGERDDKEKKKNIGSKKHGWVGPFKLIGYTEDKSRAIVQAAGIAGQTAKVWTESWKDVKIKKERKKASMEQDGSA